MAVELRWYKQDEIFLTTYSGQVVPNELTDVIEKINKYLNAANHPIHVIVDWRNAAEYPFFADFLFSGSKLIRNKNLGWLILVGDNKVVTLWVDLFRGITDFRYKIVGTLDEATQFLEKVVM